MNDRREDSLCHPRPTTRFSRSSLALRARRSHGVLSPERTRSGGLCLARSDSVDRVEGVFQELRRVAAERCRRDPRFRYGRGRPLVLRPEARLSSAKASRHAPGQHRHLRAVILVFRSVVAGLFVLAPLVCAALVNSLGLMGWFGSSLSFATATYAWWAFLSVPFCDLSLFRLARRGPEGDRSGRPCRRALQTSGRPSSSWRPPSRPATRRSSHRTSRFGGSSGRTSPS